MFLLFKRTIFRSHCPSTLDFIKWFQKIFFSVKISVHRYLRFMNYPHQTVREPLYDAPKHKGWVYRCYGWERGSNIIPTGVGYLMGGFLPNLLLQFSRRLCRLGTINPQNGVHCRSLNGPVFKTRSLKYRHLSSLINMI